MTFTREQNRSQELAGLQESVRRLVEDSAKGNAMEVIQQWAHGNADAALDTEIERGIVDLRNRIDEIQESAKTGVNLSEGVAKIMAGPAQSEGDAKQKLEAARDDWHNVVQRITDLAFEAIANPGPDDANGYVRKLNSIKDILVSEHHRMSVLEEQAQAAGV